jgi:hypothetical protein
VLHPTRHVLKPRHIHTATGTSAWNQAGPVAAHTPHERRNSSAIALASDPNQDSRALKHRVIVHVRRLLRGRKRASATVAVTLPS